MTKSCMLEWTRGRDGMMRSMSCHGIAMPRCARRWERVQWLALVLRWSGEAEVVKWTWSTLEISVWAPF